jgi:hypothetical protein
MLYETGKLLSLGEKLFQLLKAAGHVGGLDGNLDVRNERNHADKKQNGNGI